MQRTLDTSVFILSLDIELAWGTRGARGEKMRRYYKREREVIGALLDLLAKYRIGATWAVVGHLFLDGCAPCDGRKHPEIIRPSTSGAEADWFHVDPCSNLSTDPLWYGSDIVKRIQECKVTQEIGCHTFSHVIVGDPQRSEACFDSELKMCRALAEDVGVQLRSFVFPRDEVGHLAVLKKNGFACYRGRLARWYIGFPRTLRRLAHVIDEYLLPGTPAVFSTREEGLWNIPGSYVYPYRLSWARWLPISFRIRKARIGIQRAIKQRGIYHLWFHPFDLATDNRLFHGLEEIFKFVDEGRRRNQLRNLTMGELATELDGAE